MNKDSVGWQLGVNPVEPLGYRPMTYLVIRVGPYKIVMTIAP